MRKTLGRLGNGRRENPKDSRIPREKGHNISRQAVRRVLLEAQLPVAPNELHHRCTQTVNNSTCWSDRISFHPFASHAIETFGGRSREQKPEHAITQSEQRQPQTMPPDAPLHYEHPRFSTIPHWQERPEMPFSNRISQPQHVQSAHIHLLRLPLAVSSRRPSNSQKKARARAKPCLLLPSRVATDPETARYTSSLQSKSLTEPSCSPCDHSLKDTQI
jgi:hypothetical protein